MKLSYSRDHQCFNKRHFQIIIGTEYVTFTRNKAFYLKSKFIQRNGENSRRVCQQKLFNWNLRLCGGTFIITIISLTERKSLVKAMNKSNNHSVTLVYIHN